MSKQTEEHTALTQLRQGDEIGLRWMIRRYTPYVGAIVWGIVGARLTAQDAEEITADTFMAMWRYRDRLLPGKVKSYLGTIARSQSINRLRKGGLEQPLEEDELVVSADTPEGAVLLKESKERLHGFLRDMKSIDREIFLRYYYFGETAPAIANRLDMTPEAVRQRLTRGREYLRQRFKEDQEQ